MKVEMKNIVENGFKIKCMVMELISILQGQNIQETGNIINMTAKVIKINIY